MAHDDRYKHSNLWKKHLAPQSGADKYALARECLRRSFEKTRGIVASLVAKISQQLPSLTIHDITHLDELWHVADIVLGSKYQLNPAEVYVLGMTFLMHDAATSTFAYPEGLDEIRATIEWTDFVSQQGFTDRDLQLGTLQFQYTLFETLRMLHAKQAEYLPERNWKDLNGRDRFIIEDSELREHYGQFIGKIAASHGQDAAVAEALFVPILPVAPHASLPLDAKAEWSVDCLKIAMILRCVDASHIDSRRAPDVEACLLQPTGNSRDHWLFQNKLSKIAITDKGEIYWSSPAFNSENAGAWWRCYETCRMIDREIKISNRILLENRRMPLKAVGVMGADDINIFKQNVRVQGWDPVDFSFKISDIHSVIERFGGERLYGREPSLALRELLQNAADAVRARRAYSNKPLHGEITVALRKKGDAFWIDIEDDGIGMTRYVLTEVLLDFGRSLWKDPALRSQWAGLASKNFSSVGQFGIGFFSVFMLGDEVRVTSWAFGQSADKQLTLHLQNRTATRPILLAPSDDERLREPGTRVSVRLKDGLALFRNIFDWDGDKTNRKQTLAELVGYLVPALNINVRTREHSEQADVVIAADDWKSMPVDKLLRRLYPDLPSRTIQSLAPEICGIYEKDGSLVGRACLSSNYSRAILVHQGVNVGQCNGIVGLLVSENNRNLSRSNAWPVATPEALFSWTTSQLTRRSSHWSTELTERAVSLGLQSDDLIVGQLNEKPITIGEVLSKIKKSRKSTFAFLLEYPECPDDISEDDFHNFELFPDIVDMTGYSYIGQRYDFGLDTWAEEVLPSNDNSPRSALEFIDFKIKTSISDVSVTIANCDVGTVWGRKIEAECLIVRRAKSKRKPSH